MSLPAAVRLLGYGCSLLIGFSCLVVAIFLTEPEEADLRSRLESWWIRLDDGRQQALSREALLFRRSATAMLRLLDRTWGPAFISFQAVGVSFTASFSFSLR